MNANLVLIATLGLLLSPPVVNAQVFRLAETETFTPQDKKVLLLKDTASQKTIILFQTNLRVNTDGSPLSYHPQDPRGQTKALNNVCNAIAVRKGTSTANLCLTSFREAIGVFEQWRDSNYRTIPPGYRISWKNVFPTVRENNTDVPCIFKSGRFAGYFGSLTALKNDLAGDLGECEIRNQVDPIAVTALVLVGGTNVVKTFGAAVGDLLVAYNPKTQLFSSAIIGDTGPPDNLGEGSILLNMKLRGVAAPPTNKAETYALSIADTQVLIAIIPSSHLFQPARPFTTENIKQRVEAWQREAGFSTPEKFIEFMKSFQPGLR